MKLKSLLTAIVFSSASLLFSIISQAKSDNNGQILLDKVVAIVNDSVITESQLNYQMQVAQQQLKMSHTPSPKNLRQKVLKQLIDKELQLQAAKNVGMSIDEETIDKSIEEIANRNNLKVESLKTELQKQGMSYAQYRKEIKQQMLLSQIQQQAAAGKINVSEQEVAQTAATLKPHPANNNSMMEYLVEDIVVGLSATPSSEELQQQRNKAEALLAQLRKGENFEKLAAEESAGQQALQGGSLGWRKLSELPELFAQHVSSLKKGELAGPLRASNGFHIIRLAGIREQGREIQPQAIETQVRQIFLKKDPLTTATANRLRLDSLRNDIIHGKSFAKLAEENSQDPNTAPKGGMMGWIKPGMVDPNFEQIMNKLKPGEISQPFATQYGWHLIQVMARRKLSNNKDLLLEQARQIVFKRKAEEAVDSWLQELRGQAYIKIIDQST